MPIHAPQWTEFLSCIICYNMFDEAKYRPISLGCGHTVCKACLAKLHQKKCPFDQNPITRDISELPVNFALLQLVGVAVPDVQEGVANEGLADDLQYYNSAKKCIEELAIFLKPIPTTTVTSASSSVSTSPTPIISKPMQRKLVTLVNCQLLEEEGRARAVRAARSLGERTVMELILQHQNPQQLSANLWAAVRARGCQFLGPAMQEEVLKLILLALEDGSALSRKVLVLFVVQRLEAQYPQASKTAIGHVVQLLYRASCFKVTKREEESSLMQLKEEFRTYEALRREHDTQIVQIATEAGLRISPEQWSSLLYGDTAHKSHMQSIIDKLQTPLAFGQSVSELVIALQRTGDPGNLSRLRPHLDLLANIDPSPEAPPPSWENLEAIMKAVRTVVQGLVEFIQSCVLRRAEPHQPALNAKYKTSMCRDLTQKGSCPRGVNCTFAHSHEEMEKYRIRNKKFGKRPDNQVPEQHVAVKTPTSSALTPREKAELSAVTRAAEAKLVPFSRASASGGSTSVTDSSTQGGQCCQGVPGSRVRATVPSTMSALETIMANGGRSMRNVSVPVAKPSILTHTAKTSISNQTIYTSPTVLGDQEVRPGTIPATQTAPSVAVYYPIESPYYTPESLYGVPLMRRLDVDTGSQCGSGRVDTSNVTSACTKGPQADDEGVANMTSQLPSPAHPLQQLHRRKNELLSQLNRKSMRGASPGVSDQGDGSCPSVNMTTMVAPPSMVHMGSIYVTTENTSTQGQGVLMTSLAKSVADTLATSRTTMTLAQRAGDTAVSKSCRSNSLELPAYLTWSQMDDDTYPGPEDEDDSSSLPSWSEGSEGGPCEFSPSGEFLEGDNDEFIPFEHTRVSKYGPISRNFRTRGRYTLPVQVTAAQQKDTTSVSCIPASHRPHPNAAEVSTRFGPNSSLPLPGRPFVVPLPPRDGALVASSLPTALMKPTVMATASCCEPKTMWSLKETLASMPDLYKSSTAPYSAERDLIRNELVQLTHQIDLLELSENERMARELQAIEMSIQEVEHHMGTEMQDFLLARQQQRLELSRERQKQKQEACDLRMAKQMALEEAEKGVEMIEAEPSEENGT